MSYISAKPKVVFPVFCCSKPRVKSSTTSGRASRQKTDNVAVPDDSYLSQYSKDLSLQQTFTAIEQNLDENNLDLDDQDDVLPSAAG